MTAHRPWIDRLSHRFFEVPLESAFRDLVEAYLKRRGMSDTALGKALGDGDLIRRRWRGGTSLRLDTADEVLEFMGEPPFRALVMGELEAYLAITGTKAYVLGGEALNDPSFVTRLRAGASPTLRTLDVVRAWMGAHSTAEERKAIGAVTLHESWSLVGDAGRKGPLAARGNGQGEAGMTERQKYLNTPDAARYLGLKPRTLEGLRLDGGGPPYHKFGRGVRYLREDLDTWARARRRSHTGDDGAARERRMQ